MEFDVEQILIEGAKSYGLKLELFHVEQFKNYCSLLLDYNKRVNLTAITNEFDIYTKHFLDSLSVYKTNLLNGNEKIIDVGTGAGFPAIPLKIIFPDLKVTLLDSLKKRILFLEYLVESLNLKNVDFVHGRAEDIGHVDKYREKFDLVFSRAVASLNILLEYMSPFANINGYLIALKGNKAEDEINLSKNSFNKLNLLYYKNIDIDIPFTDIKHNIIILKKLNKLDKKYPRKPNIIKSKPL
ncbi:MAG: 16S rRNA (guanine(527)-N(7))-methyltransferase RsmG [Thermoanaerobacteraceae bacterium]